MLTEDKVRDYLVISDFETFWLHMTRQGQTIRRTMGRTRKGLFSFENEEMRTEEFPKITLLVVPAFLRVLLARIQ